MTPPPTKSWTSRDGLWRGSYAEYASDVATASFDMVAVRKLSAPGAAEFELQEGSVVRSAAEALAFLVEISGLTADDFVEDETPQHVEED